MTLLLIYLALAIGVSFFCSISEAVMLSLRPSYIGVLQKSKPKRAQLLQDLYNNLDRPLAAILTANTISHTVGAAGVGAQATVVFGDGSLGVVSAVLTFLILVFSEIIPKTIGATYWQQLAPLFGLLVHWMTIALAPLVWMSEKLTKLLSRSGASAFTFSRDEMRAMVEIGVKEGLLDPKELKIVGNLMRLHKLPVRSIMTPRAVIFSVDENTTVNDFFNKYADNPFSRIPVYDNDGDNLTGYVLKTDLLIAQARDQFKKNLSEFKREFLAVPDMLSAFGVYERLMHDKSHIALVVDEYGSVRGLVTLEDVVETIIGLEITDETDTVEDMQKLAQQRWRDRVTAMGIDPESLQDPAEKNEK